jgi:ssDNA-binding replication factor A large subunit
MVKVGGEEVKIKNVVIEDESGHAKVTLWRELASADVRTGEFVQITDVQTNYYMDQTSLSTTMRSNLEVSNSLCYFINLC